MSPNTLDELVGQNNSIISSSVGGGGGVLQHFGFGAPRSILVGVLVNQIFWSRGCARIRQPLG